MDEYFENIDVEGIAVNLYYLANGIQDCFHHEKSEDITFYYAQSGDEIIHELYPYARAIEQAWMNREFNHDGPGVFYYEITEDLAARLYMELIDPDDDPDLRAEHPDINQWQSLINVMVEMWCLEKFNISNPILPQIEAYKIST